jgi:thiol-disulfide isomerase/thioredoxin
METFIRGGDFFDAVDDIWRVERKYRSFKDTLGYVVLILVLVIVLTLVVVSSKKKSSEDENDAGGVRDASSPEEAEQFLKKGPTVVLMHATWCGHCRAMENDYTAAATESKGVAFRRVESAHSRALFDKYKLRGYPTIFGVKRNGDVVNYSGGRSKDQLLQFAKTL